MTNTEPTCTEHDHSAHEHVKRPEALIQAAAKMCSAMGDPSRLRLLELLFDGQHCVSELAEETGDSMSSISQRLKLLFEAQLVTKQRQGKHIYYSLADDHIQQILQQLFSHADCQTI